MSTQVNCPMGPLVLSLCVFLIFWSPGCMLIRDSMGEHPGGMQDHVTRERDSSRPSNGVDARGRSIGAVSRVNAEAEHWRQTHVGVFKASCARLVSKLACDCVSRQSRVFPLFSLFFTSFPFFFTFLKLPLFSFSYFLHFFNLFLPFSLFPEPGWYFRFSTSHDSTPHLQSIVHKAVLHDV